MTMARGRSLAMFLVLSLMANAFCAPSDVFRQRRAIADNKSNSKQSVNTIASKITSLNSASMESSTTGVSKDSKENTSSAEDSKISSSTSTTTSVAIDPDKSDTSSGDDDSSAEQNAPSSSGGSNIFSLLNFASALFPASGSGSGSSGTNAKINDVIVKKVIQDLIRMNRNHPQVLQKRQDVADNEIDIDYTDQKPPPSQIQEIDETDESADSNSEESEEDNGAEESIEKESTENGSSNSKVDSASNASNGSGADDDDNDSDYDEPEGDGQGGGILGLLAGLSGDGESDLGTLLATVGGIVASLSGDGVDINAIIATGLGLFVGLLSEGNQNPGEIIGSYLLTSLDTITGGGAKNNGAFFGKFLSTLIKGTSAGGDPDASESEEGNGMKMADSAGFFASLLMGLLGDMSKTSSGGSWR